MRRMKMMIPGIASAGYDALCAILELEFLPRGEIWQFYDVPEYIWYEWRRSREAVIYFHTHIAGRYEGRHILSEAESESLSEAESESPHCIISHFLL